MIQLEKNNTFAIWDEEDHSNGIEVLSREMSP
jgi:hypothetical protein